jgi:UPF0755 protein
MSAPLRIDPGVKLEVLPGQAPAEVAAALEQSGVVRSARGLLAMALTGKDRAIRHGLHSFEGAMSPAQVLRELARPPRPTVKLTIPEGLGWAEIAELLEKEGLANAEDYRRAVCDPAFLALAGASEAANCAEGYLFPDTYRLSPGMSAAAIARLQLARFREVIDALLAENPETAALHGDERSGLIERTVVLASIIEKETWRNSERPIIASVFHNRLGRNMRLQADPTVIYGLRTSGVSWAGNLKREHLRRRGPYNTYTRNGLPAGPISNPGLETLRAALKPAKTDYLFFVARRDGTHAFSTTLAEHNRAVRTHQLRR